MRTCWYCKKRIAEEVRKCHFCTADQQTPGKRPRAAKRVEELRRGQPVGFIVMGEAATRRRRSRVGVIAAVAVIAIAATIWALIPTRLNTASLQAFGEAPCALTDRCVVAYLAGWSPASVRTLGTLRLMAEADPELGLGVVIAADEAENVDAMIAALPVGGWVDIDGKVPDQLNISTVPTWVVLDRSGKVIQRVDGTYQPIGYHRQKLGLRPPPPPQ